MQQPFCNTDKCSFSSSSNHRGRCAYAHDWQYYQQYTVKMCIHKHCLVSLDDNDHAQDSHAKDATKAVTLPWRLAHYTTLYLELLQPFQVSLLPSCVIFCNAEICWPNFGEDLHILGRPMCCDLQATQPQSQKAYKHAKQLMNETKSKFSPWDSCYKCRGPVVWASQETHGLQMTYNL